MSRDTASLEKWLIIYTVMKQKQRQKVYLIKVTLVEPIEVCSLDAFPSEIHYASLHVLSYIAIFCMFFSLTFFI